MQDEVVERVMSLLEASVGALPLSYHGAPIGVYLRRKWFWFMLI